MQVHELLSASRVVVDPDGARVTDKASALNVLAQLIAPAIDQPEAVVRELLSKREALHSTGIGEGVAIPHASLEGITQRLGALLLCPQGIPFEAIDGKPVSIILGIVGPKNATGDHLRVLARASRLLREGAMRQELLERRTSQSALALLESAPGH